MEYRLKDSDLTRCYVIAETLLRYSSAFEGGVCTVEDEDIWSSGKDLYLAHLILDRLHLGPYRTNHEYLIQITPEVKEPLMSLVSLSISNGWLTTVKSPTGFWISFDHDSFMTWGGQATEADFDCLHKLGKLFGHSMDSRYQAANSAPLANFKRLINRALDHLRSSRGEHNGS